MSTILVLLSAVLIIYGILWLFSAVVVITTSKLPKSMLTTDDLINFALYFLSFVVISNIILTTIKEVL